MCMCTCSKYIRVCACVSQLYVHVTSKGEFIIHTKVTNSALVVVKLKRQPATQQNRKDITVYINFTLHVRYGE